ncbi:vicilin-like seed storage protein At2g18540 isoform X2 [Portunus trituberculatus]|uniref:vicilin-like seed storage protein At2g18540 isoform X2 n=1 Tax=Portunus trituberculatus TaxID=210409 RepID=UPI001E1D1831|nr:vicilin-like seed storage protein At2g18540 isoform X2 [Portunus trituberculatus]
MKRKEEEMKKKEEEMRKRKEEMSGHITQLKETHNDKLRNLEKERENLQNKLDEMEESVSERMEMRKKMNSLEEANDILNVKISLMKAKMKHLRSVGTASERQGDGGEECQGEVDKISECLGKRVREEENTCINFRKKWKIDARKEEKEENESESKEENEYPSKSKEESKSIRERRGEPITDSQNTQVIPATIDLTSQRPTDANRGHVGVKMSCRVTRIMSRSQGSQQQHLESAKVTTRKERKQENVNAVKERGLEGLSSKVKEGLNSLPTGSDSPGIIRRSTAVATISRRKKLLPLRAIDTNSPCKMRENECKRSLRSSSSSISSSSSSAAAAAKLRTRARRPKYQKDEDYR